ncbi:hypothetical protein H8356DRAFT_1361847 [Neocallimastix lanati (nom. inval.)]|nr:hypothetical protein H8356DRAFT_1361847 [Neocallimastix sp. JGI-2020a]
MNNNFTDSENRNYNNINDTENNNIVTDNMVKFCVNISSNFLNNECVNNVNDGVPFIDNFLFGGRDGDSIDF